MAMRPSTAGHLKHTSFFQHVDRGDRGYPDVRVSSPRSWTAGIRPNSPRPACSKNAVAARLGTGRAARDPRLSL